MASEPDGVNPGQGELDVAARGWDHEGWRGTFYPPDLPAEWRLAFYANEFRAVVVPGEVWAMATAEDVAQWEEDTPEDFRFYAELTPEVISRFSGSGGPVQGLALLGPVRGRLAGVLVNPEPHLDRGAWLDALGGVPDIIVGDLTGDPWSPGQTATPGGCTGVLIGAVTDLKRLRAHVETFMRFAERCPRALLCFDGSPPSIDTMKSARIIAELLGG